MAKPPFGPFDSDRVDVRQIAVGRERTVGHPSGSRSRPVSLIPAINEALQVQPVDVVTLKLPLGTCSLDHSAAGLTARASGHRIERDLRLFVARQFHDGERPSR